MALITEAEVRRAARARAAREATTVEAALRRVARAQAARYDVFMSQTARDREIVLGVYEMLVTSGKTVFVDWIDSPGTDRSEVTPGNAAIIRAKMMASDSLLFVDSPGSVQSTWMCWEIGWFDAAKGRVAVLPVLADRNDLHRGREFLGLYPYVDRDGLGKLRISLPPRRSGQTSTFREAIGAASSMTLDAWMRSAAGTLRPSA